MKATITTALLLAATLTACTSLIAPKVKTELAELKGGNYQLDPNHTAVLFKVNHSGFSKFVGRFETAAARLDFDPDNITQAKLDARVNTDSLNVNNPSFEDTLKGGDWFDTATHPEAQFITERAELLEGNQVRFYGQLTLRGVTAPISLDVNFNGGAYSLLNNAYTIGFAAKGTILRSDFGMDKYLDLVGDEVELEIHAEFTKR
jgi:polyisoprenoid-binding protein YceI